MLARFLLQPILAPRAVFAAASLVTLHGFGEDGMVATFGVWLLCTFWTFVSATGGAPHREARHEAKPEPRSREEREERKKQEEAESERIIFVARVLICVTVVVGGCWIAAAQKFAELEEWTGLVILMSVLDCLCTLLLLRWFNGWQSFVRAEAWREVRREHARYRHLIADACPLPVILAELNALGSDVTPAQAWKAANEILRRIHEAARKATEDLAKVRDEREQSEREKAEAERKKPEPLPLPDEPVITSALESGGELTPTVPVPTEPAPDLRAEWEAMREAAKEYATRKGLPLDVLAGELERIDEEFRRRGLP